MSQKFYSEVTLEALNNATTDTDHFLVGDSGTIKYRTGTQLLSDLGVNPGVAHTVSNEVKAGVAINKGQAVYVTSADGTNIIVGLASNASEATSSKTLGLLDATVATNGFANVVEIGRLSGLNTLGATAGDPVWLGVNGNLIYGLANKPYAPAHLVFIGIVTRVNSNNGEIFVNVQNGFELKEIHDVDIITNVPINGDVLGYDGTLWVNKTIAEWLGYTPANASGTTNYVSKFTGTTSLGNSLLFDNGTNVGIGTTSPINYTNKTNLAIQGTWGGQLDIMAGSTSHAQFGSDNYDSGLSARIQSADGIVFKTNGGSERMRITSGGNVGIGTSSPGAKLDVATNSSGTTIIVGRGSGQSSIKANSDNGGYLALDSTGGELILNHYSSANMWMVTGGGNVGIGTTSPFSNAKLQIRPSSDVNIAFQPSNGLSSGGKINAFDDAASVNVNLELNGLNLGFKTNETERMRITEAGNVGIGTSGPGVRFVNAGAPLADNPTLGSGTIGSQALISANGLYGMYSGVSSNGDVWHQVQRNDGNITPYNLLLQPSGGNVGIGTTSPNNKLEVSGAVVSTGGGSFGLGGTFGFGSSQTSITGDALMAYVAINTGGSGEKMRVDINGNVGIGTSSQSSKLQINASSWALSTANVSRMLQKSVGIAGDYEQHVILLHPIYNGSLIDYNKCSGSIFASRGGTSSGLINDTYYLDTASAYNSYNGTINSVIGNGKLYTCDYNGVKYLALLPDYRTSAVQYNFDGYVNSTGEELKLVVYRMSNSGTIVNSEVNSSLTLFSAGTTYYQGNVTFSSLAGSGSRMVIADANGLLSTQTIPTGTISGSGTTNYVSKFTGSSSLGNSLIYDNGTNVGIGTTSPSAKLQVDGNATSGNYAAYINNASGGGNVLKLYNHDWDVTDYLLYATNGGGYSFVIDGNGKVGIGTTSPIDKFHVVGGVTSTGLANTLDGNVGSIQMGYDGTSGIIRTWYSSPLKFQSYNYQSWETSGSERMRITSAGDVAVGTSAALLNTSGRGNITINGSSESILTLATGGTWKSYFFTTGGNTLLGAANEMTFGTNGGTERMRITSAGAVGIGTSYPTGKLDLVDYDRGIDGYGNFNIFTNDSAATSKGGSIAFGGNNSSGGTTPYPFAKIQGIKSSEAGSYRGALRFATAAASSELIERMRIDHNGNVGIGTSSPNGRLQVASAAAGDAQIWLQSTTYTGGYSTLGYDANTGEFRIKQNDGGTAGITFYTGATGSEKMRITPSGFVGIGTTNPASRLDVVGSVYFSDANSYSYFQSSGFGAKTDYAGYNAGIVSNLSTLDSNYNVSLYASDNSNTYPAALTVQSDGGTSTGTTNRQQLSMEGLIQDETIPFDTTIPIKWIKVYNVDDNTHYFIPAYQ